MDEICHTEFQKNTVTSIPSPSPFAELKLIKIVDNVRKWKSTGVPGESKYVLPRIVVFGKYACGKSSFLNSLLWVSKFKGIGVPGEFIPEVPSSRQNGGDGGNTNRLRKVKIDNMEFVDTRGYPAGAQYTYDEIYRIFNGYRDFITDVTWEEKRYRDYLDYLKPPGQPMDFPVLVVSTKIPNDPDLKRVIANIKAASGCIPVIVVTSKQKMSVKDQTQMHSYVTSLGASVALFVENYLIDDEGEGPTADDLDLKKHTDLCKVIQTIQHEFDVQRQAVVESKPDWRAYEQTIMLMPWQSLLAAGALVLLAVLLMLILKMYWPFY